MVHTASNNRPLNRGLAAEVAHHKTIMAVVLDRFEVLEDALTRNDEDDIKRSVERLGQTLDEARALQAGGSLADEQVWVGVFVNFTALPEGAELLELAGPWPKHKEQIAGELTPEDVYAIYRNDGDAERLKYKIDALVRNRIGDRRTDSSNKALFEVHYSPVYLTIPRVVR